MTRRHLTPEQTARRHAILRERWPTDMPVREIMALMDRDGRHWSDSTTKKVAQGLKLRRRRPVNPPGVSVPEQSEWEIRAASAAFVAAGNEWLKRRAVDDDLHGDGISI